MRAKVVAWGSIQICQSVRARGGSNTRYRGSTTDQRYPKLAPGLSKVCTRIPLIAPHCEKITISLCAPIYSSLQYQPLFRLFRQLSVSHSLHEYLIESNSLTDYFCSVQKFSSILNRSRSMLIRIYLIGKSTTLLSLFDIFESEP